MPGWLESLLPRIVVSLLMSLFKDWRRAGEQKELGAAEQANAAAVEAEKRGREGDEIDIKVEGASDEDLDRMQRGEK